MISRNSCSASNDTFIVALKVALGDSSFMPFLAFCSIFLLGQMASSASWENFLTLSLKKSPQIQQVRYQYQVSDLSYFLALQSLDWGITFESGSLRDRTESSSKQIYHLDETQTNSLSLSKSFITGTDLTLLASTEAKKSHSASYVGIQPIQSNSYLLSLEQNLWRNSFGSGIRDQLNAARKDSEVQTLARSEAIENVLLSGGQLFWQAAVASRRYKESAAALKRYESLVKTIEKKNRNRYAAPGEYAQAQAQYYARQQQTRIYHVDYEQAVSDLKIFLPEITEDDVKWKEIDPQFQKIVAAEKSDISQTRSQRLANLQKEKLDFTAKSVDNLNRSKFALVGEVGATGVDSSTALANREWQEGRRPSLYVGVKWSQTFGSGSRTASVKNAKAQALAQEIATTTEKQRLKTRAELLKEEIGSLSDNLKSKESELKALRLAVQELTQNYNQGRIDINVLIELINRAETAESSEVEARANLELKFLEWQFLFDRIEVE
jgi:outer membrane protein TolC